MLRKQNNLTQEQIADFYEISLDQLVRDEYGVSPIEGWKATEENPENRSTQYKECIGKICDISMNSFRYAVIRNAEVISVAEE